MNTEIIEKQKEYIEKVKKINDNKNKKYYILTMGCQLNENDSEKLIGIMEEMGYSKSEDIKNADLYVINTCCVRENAEEKLFGKLGELKKIKENKNIIIEGQLGTLRDIDNGIYPFTTSSSPLAGFGAVGAGIPPYEIKKIYTIVKAYSTCVGAGAFTTEISGDEAKELRDRGGEYGAKTGRPRRVGWFDTVATRYGCMVQGATDVVLSLVDVLGYLDKIPVCTAYEIDGKIVKDFPTTIELNKAKPVYEYLDGWKCDISNIKKYEDLPENTKKYIEFIEKKIERPIKIIGNGPRREDIILK